MAQRPPVTVEERITTVLTTTRTPMGQPLCDEDLVTMAKDGDDGALTELLNRFKPHVRSKARTYFLVGGDRHDVVQEGMIGLYKAIRDYDHTRHPSFRHFADLCVTRQVISAVKAATRHKHAPLNAYVSLNSTVSGDPDDDESTFIDRIADEQGDPLHKLTSDAELASLRSFCMKVLSDLETEVLVRYVSGESYAEIADSLGRHTKAIDNAVQRIKRKLEGYVSSADATSAA